MAHMNAVAIVENFWREERLLKAGENLCGCLE